MAHSEDAPHVNGERGEMVLGVRTDTRASLAGATGDYGPLQLTANGDLRVRDDDLLAAVQVGEVPATTFVGTAAGTPKTVAAAATPEALTTSTVCKRVWIGAPCDADGVATNTKPVFIGNTTNQSVPIMPNNFEGMVFNVANAATLFVRVGVNGEGVQYRILA